MPIYYIELASIFGWALNSMAEIERAWRALKHAEFRASIEALYPPDLEPNPLPILARAVNCFRLRAPIKQPCWSARRWKSLT
jgi:hypothetical protein